MAASTPSQQEHLLLRPREAAQHLSISERQLWAHTSPPGDIPAVRVGASVRYPLAALEAFIQRQQEGGAR